VRARVTAPCPACRGVAHVACGWCAGSGRVLGSTYNRWVRSWRVEVCQDCGGDGMVCGVTCRGCNGRGRVAVPPLRVGRIARAG
jgi:DnaJ-class molecular chaperone